MTITDIWIGIILLVLMLWAFDGEPDLGDVMDMRKAAFIAEQMEQYGEYYEKEG